MLNNLLIFINLLGIFLLSLFPSQDISVQINAPAEVQAGSVFEVSLVIDKGNLQSFSRFTQELPYGLTAKRLSSANADFSFEEQRVRLIWLKLPADKLITVTYGVEVDSRLTGNFTLGGEFAYVQGNERKTMDISADGSITILPDPATPDSLLVDINDSEKLFKPKGSTGQEFVELAVNREKPKQVGNFQYMVKLLVKKGDLQKFAKIEEFIPSGYRAVEGDSKDGIFSFSQGVAKILWMNLPEAPEFTVNYTIIPEQGKKIEDLAVSGTFSYITGNTTETIPITERIESLAENTTISNADTFTANPVTTNTEEAAIPVADEEIIVKTKDPELEIPVTKTSLSTNSTEELLQAENGIYYRVQLAAGHNKVNIDKYFSRLNVKDEVKMEFHEGWRKYTTGSFQVYKDARDYRVRVWDTTPIKDAFVSAYDNGRRITVQEALMVTNHTWYR